MGEVLKGSDHHSQRAAPLDGEYRLAVYLQQDQHHGHKGQDGQIRCLFEQLHRGAVHKARDTGLKLEIGDPNFAKRVHPTAQHAQLKPILATTVVVTVNDAEPDGPKAVDATAVAVDAAIVVRLAAVLLRK